MLKTPGALYIFLRFNSSSYTIQCRFSILTFCQHLYYSTILTQCQSYISKNYHKFSVMTYCKKSKAKGLLSVYVAIAAAGAQPGTLQLFYILIQIPPVALGGICVKGRNWASAILSSFQLQITASRPPSCPLPHPLVPTYWHLRDG